MSVQNASILLSFLLGTVLLLALFVYAFVYLFQLGYIYLPATSRSDMRTPDLVGLSQFRDVSLSASDGVHIHGYWIPFQGPPSADSDKHGLPTVLFLHGSAGNLGDRLPAVARLMKSVPCHVFMLSYRGYGRSGGRPSEAGIRRDAQAAIDYLLALASPHSATVVLYGQALGAAVAFDLAARHQTKVHAMVVESPWLSLPRIVRDSWWWPFSLLRYALSEEWNSEARVLEMLDTAAATSVFPNILFISGLKTAHVPSSHSKVLYALASRAKADVKHLLVEHVVLPGACHKDLVDDPNYGISITDFLKKK